MKKTTKLLSFLLCLLLTIGTAIVPVAADDLVLGMEGKVFTASDETVLPYRIYAPTGQAPEEGYSVYIHLHGEEGRGNDNVSQTNSGMELVNKIIAEKGEETIVLVPQCAAGSQWVDVTLSQGVYSINQVAETKHAKAVMELLEEIKATYAVNESKLYLGGQSMGAYGVWDLLARYPDTFSAAIAVSGGADIAKAQSMKQVAIRAYHSANDSVVPVWGIRAMVESLEEVGGNITYEEIAGSDHAIWSQAYAVSDQVEWLFSQSLSEKQAETIFEQGDVDADSKIDANDALVVLKSAVNKVVLTDDAALRADVNLDDKIDANDALDILKFAVGRIDAFPQRASINDPLVDTSTGEISPRLITTTYTKENVIADIIPTKDGYVVRGDGAVDSTAGIQKALNDCKAAGGGTVYLPAGQYMITASLDVPSRVTLMGDWHDPDDVEGDDYGTVIFANVPSKDTNEGGLFDLGGSGGVVGVTVYYPNQSLDNVKPYPAVFYTDGRGGSYMLSTVKNCTVINGYRGIGACCHTVNSNAHEQLTIENVKGTFLYTAAEVYNQADVGTWENVVVSGRYWANAQGRWMQSVDATALNTYTSNNTVGMMLGDLEWTEFSGLTIENCNIGLRIVQGQRIQFAGSLYDVSITDCNTGIVVEDLDTRWGMLIANSVIDNGIQNNTKGLVKTVNVTMTGTKASSGSVQFAEESSIKDIELPTVAIKQPQSYLVVADLAKDGKTDVSAALQRLLNAMPSSGGIVYLPAGSYRLDQPITVPAGVQLRGSASVATRGFGGNSEGTIILSYYGDNLEEDQDPLTEKALITLNGDNAGLYGIRITYPRNGPYDSNLMTTYAVRGNGKGVYVENTTITASAYGIDFRNCDNHLIKKVVTCCYYNTFLVGGNNGVITGCLQNGTVIGRCGDPGLENWLAETDDIFTRLFDPILREKAQYIIVEKGSNQTIYNTFVYGCNTMITVNGANKLLAVNIGSDNLGSYGSQIDMKSGTATVINAMRYNGRSYKKTTGELGLYNRIAIDYKTEKNGIY